MRLRTKRIRSKRNNNLRSRKMKELHKNITHIAADNLSDKSIDMINKMVETASTKTFLKDFIAQMEHWLAKGKVEKTVGLTRLINALSAYSENKHSVKFVEDIDQPTFLMIRNLSATSWKLFCHYTGKKIEKLYYIQNEGYCGNALFWWRKGGGYTIDIRQAEKFTSEKAKTATSRAEDSFYECEYIDSLMEAKKLIIDSQYVEVSQRVIME